MSEVIKMIHNKTHITIDSDSINEVMLNPNLSERDRDLVAKVNKQVSVNDGMYGGNGVHYLRVGLSAIHCIEKAMQIAQIETIRNILDLPCGHGRVLRYLQQRFPEAELTACEIDRDGVDFCHQQFGARPAYSQSELNELALDQQFDLIWCGSLATHLDSSATLELLRFFHRHLVVGGLLVISMHGIYSLEKLRSREWDYGLSSDVIEEVIRSCDSTGYGYADYPGVTTYGISVATPLWISLHLPEAGEWHGYNFSPRCWDGHHDVYSMVRSA